MARQSLKNVYKLIEAAKEEIPVEQCFLNDLRRSVEMTDEKNRRPSSQSYKPSSMNCIRQSYYQVTGAEADNTKSSYNGIAICETGTDRHIRIQDAVAAMKANGMDCEYVDVAKFVKSRKLSYLEIKKTDSKNETKLYHKDLNISFMCDGIIKYHNHYYIIEFKTESSNKFISRKGVDPNHYQQATCYSMALGLPEVLFVYISRDTLDLKAYIFTATDEMKHGIVAYITECDEYVKKKTTPPKPVCEKKTCMYCDYSARCRKDG